MNQKVIDFYKFLSEETSFLRNKLKQEILKGEESKALETKKELIELDTILKFFDSLQGRFTDTQKGNYKTTQERKLVLCVSYIQEYAKERNIKNISFDLEELPTVDQFPKIEQVQEQLQKELGFPVTDVVIISWGSI